jgi:hypothetical protein
MIFAAYKMAAQQNYKIHPSAETLEQYKLTDTTFKPP